MHVVILRESAPRPGHPQGESPPPRCRHAATSYDGSGSVRRSCAALLNLSNRPAMSLRTVANFENWSVTIDTRSSSSRLASVKVFTRSARSPSSPASMRAIAQCELVANVLHLVDEAEHATVAGFERNEPRLQFAELGLQLAEHHQAILDVLELVLRRRRRMSKPPRCGHRCRLCRRPSRRENAERVVEIAEQPVDVLAQRRELGKLRIQMRHVVIEPLLVVGESLHALGQRAFAACAGAHRCRRPARRALRSIP